MSASDQDPKAPPPFSLRPSSTDTVGQKILTPLAKPLEKLLAFDSLQVAYEQIQEKHAKQADFLDATADVLGLHCKYDEQDLQRIPKSGPVVFVANHPFGGAEGIALAQVLRQVRPEIKVMVNDLLKSIPEFKDIFLGVNLFEGDSGSANNIGPLRSSLSILKKGGSILIFPAGTVSHLQLTKGRITDPSWSPTIGGIIRRTKATVVPIYIQGANDMLFQLAGLAHKRLRTALLPRQLLKRNNKEMYLEIGKAISFSELEHFSENDALVRYLRFRTYALEYRRANKLRAETLDSNADSEALKEVLKGIVPQGDPKSFESEIATLPDNCILADGRETTTYCVTAQQIPFLMQEIGRLREITFRLAGEGTQQAIDLDQYDPHYLHLFVWHKINKEVVGAYRLGKTDEIIRQHGPQGLYTNELYHLRKHVFESMSPALEMGRSFVQPAYQKNATALYMLWKGIGRFICQNPRYHILFGPVSISNDYSPLSRQVIVEFLKHKYGLISPNFLFKPRTRFSTKFAAKLDFGDVAPFLQDVQDLAPVIADLEVGFTNVPILLRQYLQLGANIVGFTIDPNFNDAIDCLIFLDLVNGNKKKMAKYMGEEEMAQYLSYHDVK